MWFLLLAFSQLFQVNQVLFLAKKSRPASSHQDFNLTPLLPGIIPNGLLHLPVSEKVAVRNCARYRHNRCHIGEHNTFLIPSSEATCRVMSLLLAGTGRRNTYLLIEYTAVILGAFSNANQQLSHIGWDMSHLGERNHPF